MITEDLERLAERGPHLDPSVVVASAMAECDTAHARAQRMRTMAIAAVSVALIAGMVVALVARSGVDPDDVASSVSTVTDPLVDMSDDDWVVPAELPDGYELIVATMLDGTEPSNGQLLVGGDDVDEVWISARASRNQDDGGAVEQGTVAPNEPGRLVEAVNIGGVEWQLRALVDDEGDTFGHTLEREVNDRRVSLSTSGGPENLEEIAAELRPVPDGQLDVPRLSGDSGTYVTVAALDDAEVTAHGVNGVYCVRINAPDGTGGRSCGARTEPGIPLVHSLELGGPDNSYAAGVAEPDVARIDFVTANGSSVTILPTDESGTFNQRFWITDQPAATNGRAIITYDDGTTANLERARPGQWTVIGDTATNNDPAEPDAPPAESDRACPLPPEWQQSLFVDVTAAADSPDPAELRQMSAVGGALFSSDDYWIRIARLVSDDAAKPLPGIDENGLQSEDWWESVDHHVYVMVQERALGEVGVDFCRWILQSQGDFDATRSEVEGRLGED